MIMINLKSESKLNGRRPGAAPERSGAGGSESSQTGARQYKDGAGEFDERVKVQQAAEEAARDVSAPNAEPSAMRRGRKQGR
jgi:hypothetical protein